TSTVKNTSRRHRVSKVRLSSMIYVSLLLRNMCSSKAVVALAALAELAQSYWVYSWPYEAGESCVCEEQDLEVVNSFITPSECLESFAQEDGEYCSYEGDGLSAHKCIYAVSTKVGTLNSDCRRMCATVVAG